MKQLTLILLILAPVFASAQKDFDYTLTFSKVTTYTPVTVLRNDTAVKEMNVILVKRSGKLTLFSGGGPIKEYNVLYRGTQNGMVVYMAGMRDISVIPTEPIARIIDNGVVTLYQ